jgi:hypothetical protein
MVEEEKGNGMQLWKGVEEDEDEDGEEDEDEEVSGPRKKAGKENGGGAVLLTHPITHSVLIQENILRMIGGGVAEVADKSLEGAARDAEEEQEKGREGEKDDGKKTDEESSGDEEGDDELLNLL